jgi:hypothetical protein
MSTRPELTYDGHGINGPDEYRSRIATFTNGADAAKYGPLFAAAPDLLEALRLGVENDIPTTEWLRIARAALAKAEGIA